MDCDSLEPWGSIKSCSEGFWGSWDLKVSWLWDHGCLIFRDQMWGGAGFSKSVWDPEMLRIKVSDHCFLGVRGFKMEAKGHNIPRAVDDEVAGPAGLAEHPALAPESSGMDHLPCAAIVHAGGRTSSLLEALSAHLEAEDQGWKLRKSWHMVPSATSHSVLPAKQLSPARIPVSQRSWPR